MGAESSAPHDASYVSGFDGFFHENHAPIVRALALTINDDQLARDAAAEGFARALARWGKVERYDNPTGWVYRVGLNWARSRRRKWRREVSADGFDVAAPGRNDIDSRLAPALHKLTPEHRAVVVARYYFDWSERQIAEALDIRPGTVKSRLSRALTQLADDIGTR